MDRACPGTGPQRMGNRAGVSCQDGRELREENELIGIMKPRSHLRGYIYALG